MNILEALPGGVALFAEAYQRKLASEGRGGGKVGAEAITELRDAMKNKQVKGDILLYAGQQAGQRAAPGLAAAMTASQAEQSRFQNAYNELARVASENGVESGFARLFRALKDGAKESLPLVKGLAGAFDEVTKYAAVALLTFQDIQRFFQGRDSLIGDTLFPDKESQEAAFTFMERFKGFWSEIKTLIGSIVDGWKMLFSAINWGSLLQGAGAFFSVLQNLFGALNAAISGNYAEAAERLKSAAGTALTPVTTVVNGASNLAVSTLEGIDPRVPVGSQPRPVLGLGNTQSGLDYKTEQQAQLQMAAAENAKNGFPNVTGVMPMKPSETTVTVNVYDAHDVDKISAVIQQVMEDTFRSVNVDNPNQE